MQTFSVLEAKTQLSALLKKAAAGEPVYISNRGKTVARIVPTQTPPERTLGFAPGHVPDAFFEPASEEELALWDL
ncbi:MAG: type II toxin-antitoxin system prevent-host-death family antitoxin [Clostridiales Family XIII bacterium]|nr:type II toxin-antitoxin system prevent-host-death family antitoxin [Clostridiales Family XIII bacterium]